MRKLKLLTTVLLALSLSTTAALSCNTTAYAEELLFDEGLVFTMNNIDEWDSAFKVSYSTDLISQNNEDIAVAYASFTLEEDSYVKFFGAHSLNKDTKTDWGNVRFYLYSDSGFINKKTDIDTGFGHGDNDFRTLFLKKGTYYVKMEAQALYSSDSYSVKANLAVGAVPASKLITTTQEINANKNEVSITVHNGMGSLLDNIQYRTGELDNSYADNTSYWKFHMSVGFFNGDDKTVVLEDSNSFKVTENGVYTVRIQDTSEIAYSTTFTVDTIDDIAPSVKGVKNGKTYKKTVTIKFSDKNSGIKNAALNGKKVKNGAKVKKAGNYTLIVRDKAGNSKTVKFTIKK